MITQIQGVIACSGEGSRFALSVGKTPPYPKHLEKIGEKTLLELSIEGMMRDIPVSGITITLNPVLQDLYVPVLTQFQEKYPKLPLTYVVTSRNRDNESMNEGIKRDLERGVFDLRRRKNKWHTPVIALGYGDSFTKGGIPFELHTEVANYLPRIEKGANLFVIGKGYWSAPKMYHLGMLGKLNDRPDDFFKAAEFNLQSWSVNTYLELLEAKRDLGESLTENELNLLTSEGKGRPESE